MLVVETIAKIRRAYFQDRKPIKQICRELRVSRNTVRKVIRSGATELTYECSVKPQPKIGPWRDELDRMLAENARQPKRVRLTRIRMFEELQTLGYQGGYDAVRRYAASWARSEREASAAAYVHRPVSPSLTRWVGEQHVKEDLGFIPSFADWVKAIRPEPWMGRTERIEAQVDPYLASPVVEVILDYAPTDPTLHGIADRLQAIQRRNF